MSLDIKGMDDLNNNIKQMIRKIEGASEKVVEAGARIQYQDIKNSLFHDTGLAKREITLGKAHKEKGETVINIGWTGESKSGWRIHFVEWGTVHQSPQLKITKSIERTEKAKERAMMKIIKREYDL